MITLYQFAPACGLPNASPFCMKVETYLRLAGLAYETARVDNPGKAPKGKLPYISDNGRIVCDSRLIIHYLKEKYGDPLGEGLSEKDILTHKMLGRMMDEHFYFCLLYSRWVDPSQQQATRDDFFGFLPGPLKHLIFMRVQRNMRKSLHAQGLGRHDRSDIYALGIEDIGTAAALLGANDFFGGEAPREIDATAFAFLANVIVPPYDTPLRRAAHGHDNLTAYAARMMQRVFPELTEG